MTIEEYFAHHPLKDRFTAYPAGVRSDAAALARHVLSVYTGGDIPADIPEDIAPAVGVQVLYLLEHPEIMAGSSGSIASAAAVELLKSQRADLIYLLRG